MKTSTSRCLSLLAGADGGSRSRLRVELTEAAGDGRRHELVDIAAEGGDLLDAARRDEAVQAARHPGPRSRVARGAGGEMVRFVSHPPPPRRSPPAAPPPPRPPPPRGGHTQAPHPKTPP